MRKRTSILRPAGFLVLATIALIVFIGVTGDSRRQTNAINRARSYAAQLNDRLGREKRLPLNLSTREPQSRGLGVIPMECLTSAEAYVLRHSSDIVLAAWTVPVVRAMGADGRACIFFQDGAFSVRWLTLGEFDRNRAEQQARIEELRASKSQP